MGSDKRKTIKAAGVYTAVILGAGFASGQELISYFVDYGGAGFLGLLLSSALFALVGWAIFDICVRHKIRGYKDFMDRVMGPRAGKVIEVVLGLFMFILFSTMLAAAGAAMEEAFQLPYTAGVCAVAAMCFIAFLFGMEGIVALNAFLAPVMVVGSVFVGFYTFTMTVFPVYAGGTGTVFAKAGGNWALSAVIYVSYNVITAVSVLASMDKTITSTKIARKAGMLGGLIMGVLGLSIALPLFVNYEAVAGYEIPLLALVQDNWLLMEYIYLVVLLTAVFSSAATNGCAVIEWLCGRFSFHPMTMKICIPFMGIVAAYAGFSNFVGKVYPVFGVFGFVEIALILLFFLRKR